MSSAIVTNFTYTITNFRNEQQTFSTDISIPFSGNVLELAHSIIAGQNDTMITVMSLHDDIAKQLDAFVAEHNQKFYDKRDDTLIDRARRGDVDLDRLIKSLDTLYKDEIQENSTSDQQSAEHSEADQFAQCFHRLVHSDHLAEILQREQKYAKAIGDAKRRMDAELSAMATRQQDDMDLMVDQLDISTTPDDVNRLLSKHYAELNRLRGQCEDELAAMKGHQRSEYHKWIHMLADSQEGSDTSGASGTQRGRRSSAAARFSMTPSTPVVSNRLSIVDMTQTPLLEESFTIHLGSQLKCMHNIRILSADVARLCGPLHTGDDSLSALNIALGLYSCSLAGIVVLTPVGSVHINEIVQRNANMSTDFHFDQIDDQLTAIRTRLNSVTAGTPTGSGSATPDSTTSKVRLKPGDFFITRHSNLAQVHVVYHLITDEAFAQSAEINSRHPVIMGLRNIMKSASQNDVSQLTIPTLLRHSMSEDMTVPWCTRRAELVFKCAKGFMIESASWGGSQLSTLQLLLPHDISEELYGNMCAMVPHIFRVANVKFLDEGKPQRA